MKKRYLVLAGVLAAAVAAAGCGKKDENEDKTPAPQVTVAPAQEKDDTDAGDAGLVDMQKSADENIKNVIGEKSDTAAKLVLINKTGADVTKLYIRPNTDEDEWGDDLIQGAFTFKNGEKALYYFDKNAKDADGNTVSSYDIRIVYADADRSECYFRKLPLQSITEISLLMDGSGDSSIPYASYLSSGSKKAVSTLNEVKKRLGMLDSEEEDTSSEDDAGTDNSSTAPAVSPTPAPAVTETPDDGEDDPAADPGDTSPVDEGAVKAENYIGQPLENLIGACGEPSGSDYENEPETGETGYHYYDSFTVSTTVDENGNEVVAGVW